MRETEAALEFAQSQLAEQGEESRECLTEMERTLALLAFDNPEDSPFGDLLNMMQRQKVESEQIKNVHTCRPFHYKLYISHGIDWSLLYSGLSFKQILMLY